MLVTTLRARSRLSGMRWAYTRSVSPGSVCPRYSLTALIRAVGQRSQQGLREVGRIGGAACRVVVREAVE